MPEPSEFGFEFDFIFSSGNVCGGDNGHSLGPNVQGNCLYISTHIRGVVCEGIHFANGVFGPPTNVSSSGGPGLEFKRAHVDMVGNAVPVPSYTMNMAGQQPAPSYGMLDSEGACW